MSRRCEELRERALSEGSDSPASRLWYSHARSCTDCRTELFVLETLQRQALQERQHLGRREMAALLQTAQYQLEPRRTASHALFFSWPLRIACLVVFCLIIGQLQQQFPKSAISASNRTSMTPLGTGSESAADITENPDFHNKLLQQSWPVSTSGIAQQLMHLRNRIGDRRDCLLEILENELEQSTQGKLGEKLP